MHCELQQLHFKILPLGKLYRFKSFWQECLPSPNGPMNLRKHWSNIHSIGTEGFNPWKSHWNQFWISSESVNFFNFQGSSGTAIEVFRAPLVTAFVKVRGPMPQMACCGDSQPTGWTQPPKWNTFKAVWKHVQSCSNCFCLGWRPVGFVP